MPPSTMPCAVPKASGFFEIGKQYLTQGGEVVRFVSVAFEGTNFECMCDEDGLFRYTRQQLGRVTGSPMDYSDPRNTPPEIQVQLPEAEVCA